ncbi:hypothetical protein [Legionella maioricensis]|uniref:Uncharacterized protein n=1 Tax=Legionella maioricensis TaxID=2896528 RepID=A0A9X2D1W9_9GAMM|nr:hypothetical protein [Legionella maioricensis]MCL9684898.1 hypothetical protein [Legionella maioricensis]MCL9688270.1 hypothetical protein [Legionella maioricensis]
MKIKNIMVIVLIIFNWGCAPGGENHNKASSVTGFEEYKNVDFSNLWEKDRSFQALERGISAILDGILSSSTNERHLSKKQAKLLEEYVRQNRLFCQKGFDHLWMRQLKRNLDLLEKTENNRIAFTVSKKMQELFSGRRC